MTALLALPILYRRLLNAALLTLALAAPTTHAAGFEDTIAQRTLACTACHGAQGRAGPDGYYPRIAGKPAGYLYNQLRNIKDGRRHYTLMAGLMEPLSDAYLLEIANYFSALELPYAKPLPATAGAAVMARGAALAKQGDAQAKIPACTQCHGNALTGVAPNVPGLLGLPRDYLNAQLGGWKTGQRHASAPDCMAQVANALSESDVNAVANWLSAQPLPQRARAVDTPPPKTAGAPDIACGSVLMPAAPVPSTTPSTAATSAVARGAYLARIGNCALCHTQRGGTAYAGGRRIDTPFGGVFSSNLTPHPTTGIGAWSAQDFWRALHHGESKNGRLLYPAFPYTSYTHVTREDSDALYAYLQNLPAANKPNTAHALRWPYNTQVALAAWRALSFSPAPEATSASSNAAQTPQWNRGAYLVRGLGHCSACHSSRNALGAENGRQPLSGGTLAVNGWYAPSLLSKDEASMADWNTSDIAALLRSGRAAGAHTSGPMGEVVFNSTQYLSDADATAMAVYLKSLPHQAAAPSAPAGRSALAGPSNLGAAVYDQQCAQCHGKQGQGEPGAYPALAGNRAINLPNPANLVQIVLNGGFAPATTRNPRPFGMPPFQLQLSDRELAAVLSYIRSAWGNTGSPVSEFDTTRLRLSSNP